VKQVRAQRFDSRCHRNRSLERQQPDQRWQSALLPWHGDCSCDLPKLRERGFDPDAFFSTG
jgi:hypothetical protein